MRLRADSGSFSALRATRDATRLARAILLDRVTGLAAVRCARCGRALAAATDAAHPASGFDGRVVCHICVRAEQVAEVLMTELPEPPLDLCLDEIEEWVRAGLVTAPGQPDPRPTPWGWLRGKFRQRPGPTGRR